MANDFSLSAIIVTRIVLRLFTRKNSFHVFFTTRECKWREKARESEGFSKKSIFLKLFAHLSVCFPFLP